MKAGLVTTVVGAVTQRTARIDAALARIQATVNKYQATVTRTQARITATSNTILLLIDVGVVSLTLLFVIFAAGLVLLMYVCWQFVRTGHFPSLRVVITTNKVADVRQVTGKKIVLEEPLEEEATTALEEVVEAEKPATSEEAPAAEGSADTATLAEVVEAKKPATSEEAPAAEGSADPGKEETAS